VAYTFVKLETAVPARLRNGRGMWTTTRLRASRVSDSRISLAPSWTQNPPPLADYLGFN